MASRTTTLSTLLLLAAAVLAWPAQAADTVTVKSSYANLRAEPTTHSTKLGTVNHGAKLEVLGTSGDWTQVKSGDKTGYINNKLLSR
jgi:uncharacterized protein YgiM (DUF1202 family)